MLNFCRYFLKEKWITQHSVLEELHPESLLDYQKTSEQQIPILMTCAMFAICIPFCVILKPNLGSIIMSVILLGPQSTHDHFLPGLKILPCSLLLRPSSPIRHYTCCSCCTLAGVHQPIDDYLFVFVKNYSENG